MDLGATPDHALAPAHQRPELEDLGVVAARVPAARATCEGLARFILAREAVPLAIHCGSVGTFRNRKLVGQVLRETKASRAVKLLKTLYGLRAQIVTAPATPGGPEQALSPRASATTTSTSRG